VFTNHVRIEKDSFDEVPVPADKSAQKTEGLTRRNFLTVGTTSLAVSGISLRAYAQNPEGVKKAEHDHSSSDPGPENKALLAENPNSNTPPPTDFAMSGRFGFSSTW
jgi:oxalate decarboxylase